MITQLLQNIRSTDKSKVAKAGGVAVVISLGIRAAIYAGVAIPVWGQLAGLAVGLLAHALLPAKIQEVVDDNVDKIIDVVTAIPQTYPEYPVPKDGAFAQAQAAQGQANENFNKAG